MYFKKQNIYLLISNNNNNDFNIMYNIMFFIREKNRKKLRLEEIKSNNGIRVALSCIIAYTFAIKLIYPGSISVINWALRKLKLFILTEY